MNERKYRVICYMRIESEYDKDLITKSEAEAEIDNLKLMQPENIYKIQNVETGIEYGEDEEERMV